MKSLLQALTAVAFAAAACQAAFALMAVIPAARTYGTFTTGDAIYGILLWVQTLVAKTVGAIPMSVGRNI
jgi:opacity protein-like surface antigen